MPPCPTSVKIELTGRCDYKCFFCATGMKLRETGDMQGGGRAFTKQDRSRFLQALETAVQAAKRAG